MNVCSKYYNGISSNQMSLVCLYRCNTANRRMNLWRMYLTFSCAENRPFVCANFETWLQSCKILTILIGYSFSSNKQHKMAPDDSRYIFWSAKTLSRTRKSWPGAKDLIQYWPHILGTMSVKWKLFQGEPRSLNSQ